MGENLISHYVLVDKYSKPVRLADSYNDAVKGVNTDITCIHYFDGGGAWRGVLYVDENNTVTLDQKNGKKTNSVDTVSG